MTTRSQFYQLALEANEGQANVRDDVLPVPTLDERVTLYLRAIHGNREFTEEERSNARNVLLNSMAAEIAAQADQSPKGNSLVVKRHTGRTGARKQSGLHRLQGAARAFSP